MCVEPILAVLLGVLPTLLVLLALAMGKVKVMLSLMAKLDDVLMFASVLQMPTLGVSAPGK